MLLKDPYPRDDQETFAKWYVSPNDFHMTIAESTSYSDAMCGGTLSQHYKFGLVSYRIYT